MFSRFLRFSRSLTPAVQAPKPHTHYWPALGLLAAGALWYQHSSHSFAESYRELKACAVADLVDGVMRKVQVGDNEENFIVVAKVGGQVYAVSGKCSHYGAPMQFGYLDGYTMICPWHLAQFDIRTGSVVSAP